MHAKKILGISIATICTLATSGWISSAWAVPLSLITNSGAETGDFTGWTEDAADEPWTISSSDAYQGTKSFLAGNDTSTLYQTVDLLGLGYTEEQLDSITGVSLSVWVKEYDDAGEDDIYDVGLQMLGSGLGAMALTSLPDPHVAPAEWTQRELGLGSYGAGMRYLRVVLTSEDSAGTPGNHGAMFDNITLTITGESTAPTLTSFSPADGATRIATRPELTLDFSENVNVGSGDIVIHRTSNDEAVATIDVTSDAVQGSGTETITVTLPENLQKNTEYYITIDEGAFEDTWENAYAGISSSTTWNFRTRSSDTANEPQQVLDYTITHAHAEIDEAGKAHITWQSGADTSLVQISVATEGSEWERISPFMASTEEWTWQIPTEYRGKEITFFIESTDLAIRTGGMATEPIIWNGAENQSPENQDGTTNAPSTTPATGSYIRSPHAETVYYIDNTGHRRPILDAKTFFTWESSFDVVQITTEEAIALLPLGSPLPPKPGTILVKVQSVPKVFAVEGTAEMPILRWITSESLAEEIYGENWAEYVIDIPPTMWPHLTFGSDVLSQNEINIDASNMLRNTELTTR